MKTNVKADPIFTHGEAKAQVINPEQQLRRSVMSCMLFEGEFYEDGQTISDRICSLVPLVKLETVAKIAIEAREEANLRHVPLLLVREMAKELKKQLVYLKPPRIPLHSGYKGYNFQLVRDTLARIIQRPDELAEFLSLYWKDGRCPLSSQIKKGLAVAFNKFNEHQLSKYNQDGAVKLKDVLFLCHAKPKDKEQEEAWKRLIDGKLDIPDTWETQLSAGKDKKETWTRLIQEKKLGGLAMLRNLRNMEQVNVDNSIIVQGLKSMETDRILPFRFIAAAKHAPRLEEAIEVPFLRACRQSPKLAGRTIIVVDISGSMHSQLSGRSEMTRMHAACALAAIIRESSEDGSVYATAGDDYTGQHSTKLVPPRHGFSLIDAITGLYNKLGGGGIFLTPVMKWIEDREMGHADRIVVITDEQDCADDENAPTKANPFGKYNYIINVASNKNGIGYGKWTHIDGFSQSALNYIIQSESMDTNSNNGHN